MEPHQFDKNVREMLENRAIKPSDESWAKLEAGLKGNVTLKKRNKTVYYYAAAAVVMVVLLAGGIFRNKVPQANVPIVTEIQKKSEPGDNTRETENKEELIPEVEIAEVPKPETEVVTRIPEDRSVNELSKKSSPDIKKEFYTKDTIAVAVANNADNPEDLKIKEVVAEILEIKKERGITDAEIDSLLLKAQKEIRTERILINSDHKVDAMALLQDAEDELDKSFKDKVFDALKVGLEKVKTAVAEREQ